MKRIAGLEASAQELLRPGVGGRRVNGGPFRWKLRTPLETPVCILARDRLDNALTPDRLEQASADNLADLGLVVRKQVLRHPTHDLGDLVQPRRVQAIVRIPGVADEDGDPAVRDLPDAGVAKQALYSVELTGSLSALDQMVEGSQGVGLTTTELRDQRQDRGGIRSLPG